MLFSGRLRRGRFDAGKKRDGLAEDVAVGQAVFAAPLGVGEAEAGFLPGVVQLPLELIEDAVRGPRQHLGDEDGDDAEGLGEGERANGP